MSRSSAAGPGSRMACGVGIVVCIVAPLRPAVAQLADRDGHLPRAGQLWIEAAPTFQNWSEQYALDSPGTADGRREPIATHYGGPITARLFPGVDPLLAVVNTDADALGFTALTAGQVSMGSLDYGVVNIDRREIPFSLSFGVMDRLAVEVTAPLVRTHVEAPVTFDSVTANLVRADAAVSETFLSTLAASRAQLQALVDGGTLTPEEQAAALVLLEQSGDFSAALSTRIAADGYLFTAGSTAGQQIATRYDGFAAGFGGFGISVPSFSLPAQATSADLDAYFGRSPLNGQKPGAATRGWSLGQVVVGVRVGLIDTFGRPDRRVPPPTVYSVPEIEFPADTARLATPDSVPGSESPDPDPDDRAGGETESVPAPASAGSNAEAAQEGPPEIDRLAQRAMAEEQLAAYERGVRFRMTVGVRYRFAASKPDAEPYLVPSVFLQEPIGAGQADWEFELFQDVQLGSKLLLALGARYGIRQGDELTRRVSAPDRPYALAGQEAVLRRNLGNYFYLRVSPQVRLADALSLGVEYSMWNKQADGYSGTQGSTIETGPLSQETKETRHRLGVGVFYRTTTRHALGLSSLPIELAFIYQTAVAGSGGRTPVSETVTGSLRVPVRIF